MRKSSQLWKISLTCSPASAEKIGEALEEAAVSVTLLVPPRKDEAQVEAIFSEIPNMSAVNTKLALLAMINSTKITNIVLSEVGNLDWLKKVAADFPPLPIARWTVYGAEHRHKICNHAFAMQIDATSAFGTGEHPTTRGCLLMLDWVLKKHSPRKNLLDVGCGSGILAMAFAKACHGQAVAVDLDDQSVAIAKYNIKTNGLMSFVHVGKSNGYNSALVRGEAPYDLIMANIFAKPLCLMAKDLKRNLRAGGIAILSGLLNTQANAVISAHKAQGLSLIKRMNLGGWSVLALGNR